MIAMTEHTISCLLIFKCPVASVVPERRMDLLPILNAVHLASSWC